MLLLIILTCAFIRRRWRLLRVFQVGKRWGAGSRRNGPAYRGDRVLGRWVALTRFPTSGN